MLDGCLATKTCLMKISGSMSAGITRKKVRILLFCCSLLLMLFTDSPPIGCHEAYYRSKVDQSVKVPHTKNELAFLASELVNVEVSQKVCWRGFRHVCGILTTIAPCQYSEEDAYLLFSESNLRPIQRWSDPSTGYSLWLLERPVFTFPLLRGPSAQGLSNTPFGIPLFEDFQTMWAAWDIITRKMIPDFMLFQKPIDLRHICLFYCGHIPAFLDIHLSRLLSEKNTEPEAFKVCLSILVACQ